MDLPHLRCENETLIALQDSNAAHISVIRIEKHTGNCRIMAGDFPRQMIVCRDSYPTEDFLGETYVE